MDRPGRDRAASGDVVDADALIELASDDWAWVLVHVRALLDDIGQDTLGPAGARLRALPVGRLAGGPDRDELCRFLADDVQVRTRLVERLGGRSDLPAAVARAVGLASADGEAPAQADGDTSDRGRPVGDTSDGGEGTEREMIAELRGRLRTMRAERDEQRRRAEGAEARARRFEDDRDRQIEAREAVERKLASLEQALDAAADDQRRAVERERRRFAARVAQLEEQLTELRRDVERRRARDRQGDHDRGGASEPTRRTRSDAKREVAASSGVVPGRPTRIPDGVEATTREFAELLLERGRLVLVDGYNVTLRHRGELPLAEQRRWLTQLAATAAQRRGVRIELVFDGAQGPSHASAGRAPRDVRVRFTAEGIIADDEIVLTVEATDEPVVVVTDDVELAERVRAADADVLGVDPFIWAVR